MKIPSLCPVCGDPLETRYFSNGVGKKQSMQKDCTNKLDHWLRYVADEDATDVEEYVIALKRDPLLRACWNFKENTIIVLPGTLEEIMRQGLDERPTRITFFDPEPYKHKELVTKLKTYLVFS